MSTPQRKARRGGSPAAERLLERAEQLDALAGWAGEAVRAGRVVLVAGEAGVGKTALVDGFLRGLPPRTPVFRGWCEALSAPQPLAPLLDVAAQSGGPLAEAVASSAGPMVLAEALLRTLARWPGTVLVIEDLHWADDATFDLVRVVSRRIADVPAVLVAMYRDDEIGAVHSLRVLLGDLGARRAVRRLRLLPLTKDAVAELAVGSDVDSGELFRQTGGNPFFVTEVLAAGTTGIPVTVREAVLARAARLSSPGRRTLDAAAVLGEPLDLDLLRTVADADTAHLDECAEAGMLRVQGARVAFRHELGRIAVEEAIPPGRRTALHGAVLRQLVAGGAASAARLAHHAAAAGDRPAVRRYAEQAARQAVRLGAHREAAAQFRRVLAALDPGAMRERAESLARYSQECALSDQIAEATESAEQTLRIWRAAGDRLREGDTVRWLSRLAWMSERVGDAERLARQAIDLLQPLPAGRELAHAYANLAQQLAAEQQLDDVPVWGERALRLAEALGEQEIAAQATIDLGLARALGDQTDHGGVRLLEEGARRAQDLGFDGQAARGLFQLGRVAWQHRRFAEVERRMRTAEAFCAERGAEFWRDYCMAFRASARFEAGEWSRAETMARQVWRRTTPASPSPRTVLVCVVLGLLNARRGTPDSTDFLAVGAARARVLPWFEGTFGLAGARAEAAWLNGRLPDMAGQLREAVAELARTEYVSCWQRAELCWWLRLAGVADMKVQGDGPFLAQAAGDWQAAAAGWQALGCPYHRAQALAGADDEGPLREALEICRALGAVPLARHIAHRLRGLGVRDIPRIASRSAAEDPAGLTGRELEVLTLLADGLRDADIAERLVVSPRTVHHHVSAIMGKLDARTRTAAVAAAARLGLLTLEDR